MVYLAGDIGGTKTHLALYESQGERVVMIAEKKYPSQNYTDLNPSFDFELFLKNIEDEQFT